jgi:hypothetical protein
MKKRYKINVKERSIKEEYTVIIETDDIAWTLEQYGRNRDIEKIDAEVVIDDEDFFGPNKSVGV